MRCCCHYAQVLKRNPAAKLLLCAPQNYSADLLASALSAKVPPSDMLRLNDPRRPPNQVRLPHQHCTQCKCIAAVAHCPWQILFTKL